jgi:hypothetical protein
MLTMHDLSAPLLRQRRNLIVVSLLILFLKIAKADVSSYSGLGLVISLGRPEAVMWFLWMFLVYYSVRYTQYLQQESTSVREEFYGHLKTLSGPRLMEFKVAAFPGSERYGGEFDFRRMRRLSFWKREVSGVSRSDAIGGQVVEPYTIDLRHFTGPFLFAVLHVLFRRSYFTDYALPIVLALAAALSNLVS